jgi:hypothetical protein
VEAYFSLFCGDQAGYRISAMIVLVAQPVQFDVAMLLRGGKKHDRRFVADKLQIASVTLQQVEIDGAHLEESPRRRRGKGSMRDANARNRISIVPTILADLSIIDPTSTTDAWLAADSRIGR